MLLKNSSQIPKQAYSDLYYPNALVWAEEYPKEFVGILKGNINIYIKPDKAKVFVDEHIYDCLMSMSIEDNLKRFNVKYNTHEYKDALEWIEQFPMTYTDVLLGRAELIKKSRVK